MGNFKDLAGKRFGNLTVVKRVDNYIFKSGQQKTRYECLCDCGNTTFVIAQDLTKGHTTSCGCLKGKGSGRHATDLTGERFGKLIVIKRVDDYKYKTSNGNYTISPCWLCKCDCGGYHISQAGNLRSGACTSCGCNGASKNENIIANLLIENGVKIFREVSYNDLKDKARYRFDFALLNEDFETVALLEYQSESHYKNINFGRYQREVSDVAKKEYCDKNNIKLYEIKYDDDIECEIEKILCGINE